jgi:hypothetical protein
VCGQTPHGPARPAVARRAESPRGKGVCTKTRKNSKNASARRRSRNAVQRVGPREGLWERPAISLPSFLAFPTPRRVGTPDGYFHSAAFACTRTLQRFCGLCCFCRNSLHPMEFLPARSRRVLRAPAGFAEPGSAAEETRPARGVGAPGISRRRFEQSRRVSKPAKNRRLSSNILLCTGDGPSCRNRIAPLRPSGMGRKTRQEGNTA